MCVARPLFGHPQATWTGQKDYTCRDDVLPEVMDIVKKMSKAKYNRREV